jgi:hypothetical protein
MGSIDGDGEPPGGRVKGQGAPTDLIDFYRRWPEFRQTAVALARRADLSPAERETVHWLILLADRIGEPDLQPRSGERNNKS